MSRNIHNNDNLFIFSSRSQFINYCLIDAQFLINQFIFKFIKCEGKKAKRSITSPESDVFKLLALSNKSTIQTERRSI